MDYWNDKDCPMWMIHLMVCLEWLLNNAFTLTTNYLCYIVSHCWPLWYAKLMFIVQTLLVSRKALLENKRQYSCSYSYPLLTIMIIDAKLLCYIHTHDLTWNGLDMCSKLWSKCLPFRASLWAFLSVFYWRFCLIGLTLYSYPGLEAHVCDGLSGWKKYVTCVKTLLLL